MAEDTLQRIADALDNGDLTRLIGLREDLHFDAKGRTPYDLDSPADRYELAKDVSSFANSEGGTILIGLKAKQILTERTEEVTGLALMSETDFPGTRLEGVVTEYIHPKIRDLSVRWIEDVGSPGEGVGCIAMPPQDPNHKLFLIKRVVEDTEVIKQIVFGIAQRIGSSSVPLEIHQLHQKIRDGMSTTAERLTRIEEKIDRLSQAQQPKSVSKEGLRDRIGRMLSRGGE